MNNQSRRSFIGTAVAAGVLAASCSKSEQRDVSVPIMLDQAPDGPMLKAGLIGCGGRGTGAARDFLSAGPNLQITALGDVFKDRLDSARNNIQKEKGQTVPEENCFVGFDAFQNVIDSDVDIVLLATPPHFRPEHFAAAVAAGKHVFMEKPVAVDPVGIKSIIESAGQAKTKNLCVVTGTQRRHQREYVETYSRVAGGAIGDIVAARCYWNQNQLWFNEKRPGWSDMEWMIRDWVNWSWLSGDHIVEQHVHNIDVVSWFTGMHPVKAVGFGGKAHRVTGDQYDFFSIDFSMENGMHVHSMCRQINGCENNVSEFVVGTEGSTNCSDTIWNPDGTVAWKFEGQKGAPYVQEHIDMVTAIRTSEPINEAQNTAESTLVGIMGRISAYTGQETTWQEMMDSDLRLGPTEYALGDVDVPRTVPVPGEK
ncbi:Gfo/Idh/MocA family protein [Candidatus Latescibacterota bacterium]